MYGDVCANKLYLYFNLSSFQEPLILPAVCSPFRKVYRLRTDQFVRYHDQLRNHKTPRKST